MPVTFGAAGGPALITGGTSPRSVNIDIGTRTNGLLLVFVTTNSSGDVVTGATYGGASMTEVAHVGAGVVTNWKVFALKAPANGSNSLSLSFSGDEFYTPQYGWIAFDGVDQTTPYGTAFTNTGTSTTPSLASQTCPTDGMLVGGCTHNFTTSGPTAGGGTTSRVSGRNVDRGLAIATRADTGAFSWTCSSSQAWSAAGLPINPAGAGGTDGNASGVTLTAAASMIAGGAGGASGATANGVTITAAASFIAGAASSPATLNFQAAGMEFGRRTGLGISTFALDAGASYRYTVHADGLTLGAAIITSSAENLDSNGKLANLTHASLVQGTTYRIVAIRQADGEAAVFRMVAA